MLPQKSLSSRVPTLTSPLIALFILKLDQSRVQRQHDGEMVRFSRRQLSQRTPESGHTITRLSADHPFSAKIDGGVRTELEDEKFGVLLSRRQHAKLKSFRHTRRP